MLYIFIGKLSESENTSRLSVDLKKVLKLVLREQDKTFQGSPNNSPNGVGFPFCCQMVLSLEEQQQYTMPTISFESWIRMAQDMAQWLAYVSKVTDTRVPLQKISNTNRSRKSET
jgi:hypothetical protein